MNLWQEWRRAFRSRKAPAICEGPRLEDIASIETLAEAWGRVRANKGGPGKDDVTIAGFALDAEERLQNLAREIGAERYRPQSLKRAIIPKPSGGVRQLNIPIIADRIVQTAALIVLEPHLDRHMSEASWAYRRGRGVPQAIAAVEAARANGFGWIVDADIEAYFDRIPHRQLKADLAIWIDDERILRLLSRWLRTFGRRGRGIAQGAPVSPLFANLYLHPIDRQFGTEGVVLVRYADDFVVLTKTQGEAKQALRQVARRLGQRGLALNDAKTRIVPPDDELSFLGCRIPPVGRQVQDQLLPAQP